MTAQETLFQTKESKKQARRAELIAKALSFWATHAETYRSLPYRYFFCLSEKQRLGLSRNKLPLTEEDWPKVPLFYIEDFETAKGWLDQKTTSELHYLVEVLEETVNHNYAYCSVRDWVKDATYLITHTTKGKNKKKTIISEEIIPWA